MSQFLKTFFLARTTYILFLKKKKREKEKKKANIPKYHLTTFSTCPSKATAQVIRPPCEPERVTDFLWQHMQRDLDVLGRALGRSVDDAALTVHLVLQRLISINGGQTSKLQFDKTIYIP